MSEENTGGLYFSNPTTVSRISSGCTMLDCVLGGGWGEGRISNIVSDKAVGKSLLAIEACANYAIKYPDATKNKIKYCEAEAAFDPTYAQSIGLPVDRVEFPKDWINTVEDFANDLNKFIESIPEDGTGLYVLDSLDALTTQAELERKVGETGYNTSKALILSSYLRNVIRPLEDKKVTLIVISQLRDKLNVTYGEKQTRSGGRALDFYASQIIWLYEVSKNKKTIDGTDREVGKRVKVKTKKNKIGLPNRECEFDILYSFGMDDVGASLDFLESEKKLDFLKLDVGLGTYKKKLSKLPFEEYVIQRDLINNEAKKVWMEIEQKFQPTRKKYQ
jgi:recombination protein RecA